MTQLFVIHRNMLAAEQRRLRQQYEARLAELEAERHGAEADLAQVPTLQWCMSHSLQELRRLFPAHGSRCSRLLLQV